MTKVIIPYWKEIHTIVFDFDGIFTDNKVWTTQDGKELVRCDRADGLAFDLLRQFVKRNNWDLKYFILSKETNPVVSARAQKMQIPCVQGNSKKAEYLQSYLKKNNYCSSGLIYLGNDLNDLPAMKIAGFSIAPSDSHPLILQQANLVLQKKGGEGFVRQFVEELLLFNKLSPAEINSFF